MSGLKWFAIDPMAKMLAKKLREDPHEWTLSSTSGIYKTTVKVDIRSGECAVRGKYFGEWTEIPINRRSRKHISAALRGAIRAREARDQEANRAALAEEIEGAKAEAWALMMGGEPETEYLQIDPAMSKPTIFSGDWDSVYEHYLQQQTALSVARAEHSFKTDRIIKFKASLLDQYPLNTNDDFDKNRGV